MKHGNDIRFAIAGSAWRRAGRLRAGGATVQRVVACLHRPSRLAVPFAVVPDAGAPVADATAARCAGNHSLAAPAATFTRAVAPVVPHVACRRRSRSTVPPPCGVDRLLPFALP
ncbi:hypothetical protein [Burkholderia sp. MSMB1072]|uniref:hypothetical protein n=1 Tax=Burkholderia sp. MSMB1072 TaxID=1637871 RepID=UPI00211D69A2|nr:hypothetical protein [Burkholderia sp. MSMB1072]